MNGILSIHKMSPHHNKKRTLEYFLMIQLITFSESIYTNILTISDPILSIGTGVEQLHYVCTLYQSPTWYDLISTKLWLKVTFSDMINFFFISEVLYLQNLWHIFKLPVANISWSTQKIFLQFQLTIVYLFSSDVYILPIYFYTVLLSRVNMIR